MQGTAGAVDSQCTNHVFSAVVKSLGESTLVFLWGKETMKAVLVAHLWILNGSDSGIAEEGQVCGQHQAVLSVG